MLIMASNATKISTIFHNKFEESIHPKNKIISVNTFKIYKYLFFMVEKKYFNDDSP